MHLALVVLNVEILGLLEKLLHTGLRKELDEGLVLGIALVSAEKQLATLLLVAGGDGLAGLIEYGIHQSLLLIVEPFHTGTILQKLLIVSLGHGTADNQRGTGIVDKHAVHLVHDGIMMFALHQVIQVGAHIVAQIVEAELVVGTEGDVAAIGLLPALRMGFVLVDAIHAQAVELIKGAHPLRVTLAQVIIDRHNVHSLACKGIEENGKGCNKGLALACRHLGHTTLTVAFTGLLCRILTAAVQHYATNQLDVIMHHIPGHFVAAGHPMVHPNGLIAFNADKLLARCGEFAVELRGFHSYFAIFLETPCSALHYGKSLRQNFLQHNLYGIIHLLHKIVLLLGEGLLAGRLDILLKFLPNLRNTRLILCRAILDNLPQSSRFRAQFIIAQSIYRRINLQYFLKSRPDGLHIPVGLGAENFSKYRSKIHNKTIYLRIYKKSPAFPMKRAIKTQQLYIQRQKRAVMS